MQPFLSKVRSAGAVRWPAYAYGLIALLACGFAFVGLDRSNFWTDELFTLHVIGHDGGLAEVWRRALTDTHPPLYYFGLYGWSRLGGTGEAWLRLPSAVFAVLALLVTARALWRRFSPAAIGFALAASSVSMFWFEQSQNARSYTLSMLLSAGLLSSALALHERWRARSEFPRWHLLLVFALGTAGGLTHSYVLLTAGMVLAWLLWVIPDLRVRAAVVLAGLLILAANVAYVWVLLHATTQDVHGGLWFDTGAKFFWGQTRMAKRDLVVAGAGAATTLLVLAAVWRRWKHGRGALQSRVPDGGRTALQLALCVLLGVIASGIVVSYAIAPSYSSRNLLTAAPFAWVLLAWCYDAAGPRLATRGSQAMAALLVLLVAGNLSLLSGRFIERNEAWRNTAQFVAQMPGCAGAPVAVMQPYKFGPSTPAYRELAARDFYGHYAAAHTQIQAWMPSELVGRHRISALSAQLAERAANAQAGGCTLLLWGVHDLDGDSALTLAQDLARAPGIAPRRIAVQTFLRGRRASTRWRMIPDGFVFYALPPAAPGAPATDPGALVKLPDGVLGDRYVVTLLGPAHGAAAADTFLMQRFSYKGDAPRQEQVIAPRVSCDLPMRAGDDIRPDPDAPGCSTPAPH
ncbi:Dolichyl-phosphate-mannose-protein mannosyltransferase [Pseudoxanthomonas sp. GM95]|nr:Dolichyl-phosphate-mannose-protein mannosyltransferase [Pseudoxanthomonas sp. GM95]